jgi:predicted permease
MVVVALGLGIGANAVMFGILDRLLFRAPAHIQDPDRVVLIHSRRLGSTGLQTSQPYAVHRDLMATESFASVAVSTRTSTSERAFYPLGRGATGSRVAGAQVTPSFFPTLGVQPALGRFFQEDEAGETNPQRLAVIGYQFWQRHFGGRQDAIGASLDIGADRYTVVGVAPEGFTGAELTNIDVWIPIAAADGLRFIKTPEWRTRRNAQWLSIYARLKPGASLDLARAQATAAFRAGQVILASEQQARFRVNPDSQEVVFSSVIPGRSSVVGLSTTSPEVKVARLLGGVSFLVLLLACANVANLLLVRALNRRSEIALRLALGVSRRRLIGQLLLEGGMLAALGAVAALMIVRVSSGFVRTTLLGSSEWGGSAVDGRMVLFTAGIALTTGILTSLLPALQTSSPDLTSALKAGVREGSSSRSITRGALLAAQAALALVLLAGAGLFVRSLQRVADLPIGVDIGRVVVANIEHSSAGLSNADARALYLQFVDRTKAVPGVTAAAASIAHSFGLGWGLNLFSGGRELEAPNMSPTQYAITPEYFQVMGIRRVAGRTFTDQDRDGSTLVAVINETAARAYWPAGDAVGSCVQMGADSLPCTTVVGIVTNARRQQLVEDPIPQIYRPLLQLPLAMTDRTVSTFGMSLLVRTGPSPASMVEPIRRAMQGTSAVVPYANVRPLSQLFGRHTRSWTLGASMFSVFGGLALVLATFGLYSVVVFSMAQRRHEYGVRMALGATGGNLVSMTVRRGMIPVLAGMFVGSLIAFAGGRFLGTLLFQTSPSDPAVLGVVVAALLASGLVASLVPAARAVKTNPVTALRAD